MQHIGVQKWGKCYTLEFLGYLYFVYDHNVNTTIDILCINFKPRFRRSDIIFLLKINVYYHDIGFNSYSPHLININ